VLALDERACVRDGRFCVGRVGFALETGVLASAPASPPSASTSPMHSAHS